MIKTLSHRKADEVERRVAAVEVIARALASHAAQNGGRYLMYGSAANGGMRYDSDIDLLIDFPPDAEADAWTKAEQLCAEHAIPCDLMPVSWCRPAFLAQVLPKARSLP